MFKIMHDVYSAKGVHAIIAAQETSILIIEKRCRSAMFDEGLIKEPLQQKKPRRVFGYRPIATQTILDQLQSASTL